MKKTIEYIVPPNEVLKQSKYIRSVIEQGRDGDASGIYILNGGREKAKEKMAGMIAVGWYNPIFDIEHSEEEELWIKDFSPEALGIDRDLNIDKVKKQKNQFFDIEDELDSWMKPQIQETKELEPMLGVSSGDKIVLVKSELTMTFDSPDEKTQLAWQQSNREEVVKELVWAGRKNDIDGYFLAGSSDFSVEKETCEVIRKILEQRDEEKPFFIAINGLSANAVRKLQFEEDAQVITVTEPGMDYYKEMLQLVLEKKDCVLEKNVNLDDVIYLVKNFRTEDFDEKDFDKVVDIAVGKAKKEGRSKLKETDFDLFDGKYERPEDKLKKMVGLQSAKEKLHRMVSLGRFNLERQGTGYEHYSYSVAFGGNPGTGKTEFAKIYSEYLSKYGITNGTFSIASKSDYVGKYVGHTASLMRKLFERNRGGVIFFDEAATFLTNDSFTQEALTELVRFMEMYPDVVCIFASYEKNIRQLMEKDQGLRSRITECIYFEDYSDEELYEIFEHFCSAEQFEVEDVRASFYDFAQKERRNNPESFGNARFSRNLFEKTKEILAWKIMQNGQKAKDIRVIPKEVVKEAIQKIRENESEQNKASFSMGFYNAAG